MNASDVYKRQKEGQVINKMLEEREKKLKREITDEDVLNGIADTAGRSGEATVRKSKSGIVVKGIHDLAVRFSKCCNPLLYEEMVANFPKTNACVQKLCTYLEKKMNCQLESEEILYLMLHVNRLCMREGKSRCV